MLGRTRRPAHARALCFAVCAAALIPREAEALDPHRALTQYIREAWRREDGLPSMTIFDITQTKDGYLWLGTNAGAARFDGARFRILDRKSTPALPSNTVWALTAARDGGVWIGTSEGLVHLAGQRVLNYSIAEGLPEKFIQVLLEDRGGRLWIGTSGGIAMWQNGRVSIPEGAGAFAKAEITSLFEDHAGRIWIGASNGLAAIDPSGDFHFYGEAQGLVGERVRAIWEDEKDRLWISERGAHQLDAGRFGPEESALPQVATALKDRQGNVWVGSRSAGVGRSSPDRFTFVGMNEGLAGDRVLSLYEDREGSIWAGLLNGGLARFRDGRVLVYGKTEGLLDDRVVDIAEDRDGAVWASTVHGLNRFKNGRWSVEKTGEGSAAGLAGTLFAAGDGALWVERGLSGVMDRLDGRSITTHTPGIGEVWEMKDSPTGGTWLAAQKGVFRLIGSRLESPVVKETVASVLEDAAGTLWMATPANGLLQWKEGRLTSFTTSNGLPSNSLGRLHLDDTGVLWFGTADAGLVRYKAGRFTSFGAREGLADSVCRVLEDGTGQLWLSSFKGIFRVARRDLEALAEGKGGALPATLFDATDGMRSAECFGGATTTRDGRLWFISTNGVAVVDPARIPRNTIAPDVHIEELVVDGGARVLDGAAVNPGETLPAGVGAVEVRYTATSLNNPGRVRFRYRLNGYDRDWTDAGSRRIAYYPRLPHGRYTFEVSARNEDGMESPRPATLKVTVEPRFYETWWARGLLAIALIGFFYGIVRLRVRTLRARAAEMEVRQGELERVVSERTDELRVTVTDLRRAQEQLSRLSIASPEKIENVAAWGASMAAEIASTIGAREIGIWSLHGDEVRALAPGRTQTPDRASLVSGSEPGGLTQPGTGASRVVPILGMTGEVRGGLVVDGAIHWGDLEQRLVLGLAQHLGSALDLRRMREHLTQTEQRQAAARRRMREEGVPAVMICRTCGACQDDSVPVCPRDGSALDATLLLPYRVDGRYRLVQFLGEGAVGRVFKAIDEKLGREVALKLIRSERLGDAEVRFRLEREARILAQIHHPAVAALFDSGELADGSAFLVMELLKGSNLSDILSAHGPGSPAQVGRLLRQAGAGLAAAHRAGVIHRDMKPANLILVADGPTFQTRVVDFGLATGSDLDARLTHTGMIVGTPTYMSPEQAQGLPIDTRSDLYSLAAVGYEALTGRRAIGGTHMGVLVGVLYTVPDPASSILPSVPADLDAAFAAALAKQPSARPTDIEGWAELVGSLLSGMEAPSDRPWPAIAFSPAAPAP